MATVPALWSEEESEILKKLTKDGLSASLIAEQLPDRTRNAVIAKWHRLGLGGRGQPSVKATAQRFRPRLPSPVDTFTASFWAEMKRKAKPVDDLPVQIPEHAPQPLMLKLEDLGERSCRWPVGDPIIEPDKFGFCGHIKRFGSSYCPFHEDLSRKPTPVPRKKKAA